MDLKLTPTNSLQYSLNSYFVILCVSVDEIDINTLV